MSYIKREKINNSINFKIRKLFSYFLKGLLITLPIYATYRIIRSLVEGIDEVLNLETPGLGFSIVVGVIMTVGLIGSSFLTRPFFELIDELLNKIPFVKTIYGSVKDLIEAFVGEKNKFSKPVLVELSPGVFKPGFITQEELIELNLPGMVAVYFPHSYAFSGNLFLVNNDKIQVFKGSSSAFMKFIVSGGVSEIDKYDNETPL
jgi:uncharacterized membrane protein